MPDDSNMEILESSLHQLEIHSNNFALRFINDSHYRRQYQQMIAEVSNKYRNAVRNGAMTAKNASEEVQLLRNQMMDATRIRLSELGRAESVRLKKVGKTLETLLNEKSQKLFKRPFSQLVKTQKNKICLEIVESAGRARPSVNAAARRLSKLGRGLFVLTIAVAAYNVATAQDKVKAIAKEGATLGGGFLGGAAGGAVAGCACGPGAPVCITVGVFVGGVLGALGADFTFDFATN